MKRTLIMIALISTSSAFGEDTPLPREDQLLVQSVAQLQAASLAQPSFCDPTGACATGSTYTKTSRQLDISKSSAVSCEQEGKPIPSQDIADSAARAETLLINEKRVIEAQPESQIKKDLLSNADKVEKLIRETPDSEISPDGKKALQQMAEQLRKQADNPKIKADLLATLDSYSPTANPKPQTWNSEWPRFRATEYAAVGVMGAVTLLADGPLKPKNPARIEGGKQNWLDEQARNFIGLRDEGGQKLANTASNILLYGLMAAPYLDIGASRLNGKIDNDSTLQLAMISTESFLFAGMLANLTKASISRDRPYVRNCPAGGECGTSDDQKSFFSGHSALVFTAAGLVCTSHSYMNLTGSPDGDNAACASMLALASATALLRVSADKHYLSDVGTGALIGILSGFVMPRYLHFEFDPSKSDKDKSGVKGMISPTVISTGPSSSLGAPGIACHLWF